MYNRKLDFSNKYKVEKKPDMRKRGIKSPNEADALAAALDLIRSRGFRYQYHTKAEYNYKFGPLAEQSLDVKRVRQRSSMISSMLGIATNFPTKKVRKRNKGGV